MSSPGPPGVQGQLLLLVEVANLLAQQSHPALWVSGGWSGCLLPRAGLHPRPTSLIARGCPARRSGTRPLWPSWGSGPTLAHSELFPRQLLSVRRSYRATGLRMSPRPAPRPVRRPPPRRQAHLALILRGGREEPCAVLLADVDNLEGEDVVGRCLFSRPHHPEGTVRAVTTRSAQPGWVLAPRTHRAPEDAGGSGWSALRMLQAKGLDASGRGKRAGKDGAEWTGLILEAAAHAAPKRGHVTLTAHQCPSTQVPPAHLGGPACWGPEHVSLRPAPAAPVRHPREHWGDVTYVAAPPSQAVGVV